MRYVILLSLFCFLGYACSDSEGEKIAPSIKPDAEGTWTDPRNGITYGWVRLGNQEWLTENMRAETAIGNYVAEDDITDEMFQVYGYLYDFEAAQSLSIDGWRLPSDEDWKELECYLGMSKEEVDAEGWRGSFVGELMVQDASGTGLSMQYGGYWYDIGGTGVRAFQLDGIYWSSSINEMLDIVYCRMLTSARGDVQRLTLSADRRLSVRLVRDVQ